MTKKRALISCPRDPIGLRQAEAASFLGMSPTLFKRLVDEGEMPSYREFKGAQIWDVDELVEAFRSRPHKRLDLPPGVAPRHDDQVTDDPWANPRA